MLAARIYVREDRGLILGKVIDGGFTPGYVYEIRGCDELGFEVVKIGPSAAASNLGGGAKFGVTMYSTPDVLVQNGGHLFTIEETIQKQNNK